MKKFHRVAAVAVFAVILVLAALCFAACGGDDNTAKAKSRYTLTFMVGTTVYETVSAEEGSEYQVKGDPSRVNHVFEGWSQKAGGEVEELPDRMPSENRTYHAIFSARYNLTLNAGAGVIPDDKKIFTVKEGDDIYALVSAVTPTVSDGDAVFAGWFLRGSDKVTETSGQKMPGSNVEAVAKYYVNYSIDIYKEVGFDTGDYPAEPDEVVRKTAYVGEKATGLPVYDDYYYDDDRENSVRYTYLSKNSAQNAFSLYYKKIGYDTVFNANLPSEVEYSGEMEKLTCGHGLDYDTPDCKFVADGYRFCGWSTTPDGEVEYRPGGKFTVTSATTLYAQWVKGLTELSGVSADRVYIMNKLDEPQRVVAYLERTGLNDVLGEYNATTHVFTFKNQNGLDPDSVLLRGIADQAHNTFTYLNTVASTVYTLQHIDGAVDSAVTLTLSDDGKAVYNDGTNIQNGNYIGGNDGSMVFTVDSEQKFAFRLVYSEENSLTNFMIRGAEYGAWNNITQAGVVDALYTLVLDGYGYATMLVAGLNSSDLNSAVISEFNGMYRYSSGEGAYDGDAGKEVIVTLFNSSLSARRFACLLMTGSYHSASSNNTTVYTNVYLQRFETTLYAAPAEGEELDVQTADKIELAGYSVTEDSATYTYTGSEGQTVTVKGKYYYDSTAGTLRIIRADGGKDLLYEVTMHGEGESRVPVFQSVEELFGQYAIYGLNSTYDKEPYVYYTLNIYNNNRAAFAFLMPVYDDSFYGNIIYEFTRVFYGEYRVAIEGKDENGSYDPHANVYEFSAQIPSDIIRYIYNLYGSWTKKPLNITGFASFRFQFVYSATTGEITSMIVTALGDFQGGRKLTYEGEEYTLDGFGKAVGADKSMSYAYTASNGMPILFLIPDDNKPDETVRFIDWRKDGTFVEYETGISTGNCGVPFFMMFFKDDTALLTLSVSSMIDAFSFGHVTWDDDDHTSGKFRRDNSIEFADIYYGVNMTIQDFRFVKGVTKNDKNENVDVIFVYDINASLTDGKIVIVNADQDELTLVPADGTATYTKKGGEGENDTEYSGTFTFVGDAVRLVYSAGSQNRAMTFKLEYGQDGAINGFRTVGNEAGYAIDAADGKSYLYLSGEAAAEQGTYTAVYNKYDADNDCFTAYNGTYCAAKEENVSGYDFTYATGETDENGADVTETFTFGLGTQSGIKFFQRYTMKLNTYVMYMSASLGKPAVVGQLNGGGYSAQVFTLFQTQYQGSFEWNDEWKVWVFSATDGSLFYFKVLNGVGVFLLDNTYVAEAKGIFTLSEPVEVDVPATEGQPETEDSEEILAVPAHKATVTKIEMSGMAFAYLYYDYTNDGGSIEEKIITGLYVQYAANGFAFIMIDNEDATALFRFRLMAHTNDETGEVTYVAELADMDYFGTFIGDDLTVINLNGYDYAYYVDSFGRVFSGTFEITERSGNTALIKITYIDRLNYTVGYAYASLDIENRTFTPVAAPNVPETPESVG